MSERRNTSITLTKGQAKRYQAVILRLARYEIDEPWTEAHRKRLGLTVQGERDLWSMYWKFGAVS